MSKSKNTRKSISKSLRFEVFKRDRFTCQYCGRKSPDVILQIDHIHPVSKGGNNDILNLITSCEDCNSGKRDKQLTDTTIIDRKRTQLEELQERREQIEMMMEWQKGLVELDNYLVEQIAEFWSELVKPYSLTEQGLKSLKKLLRQNNAEELMEAMRIAVQQYVKYDENDEITEESISYAWSKIGGICKTKKMEHIKPYLKDLYYIRGILRKRLNYVNDHLVLKLLEEAYNYGADVEKLKDHACQVRTWTQWRQEIESFVKNEKEHENENESEISKLFEICNSYAESKDCMKIVKLCNQVVNPNDTHTINLILEQDNWFVLFDENCFLMDYERLENWFNRHYKHWMMNAQDKYLCMLNEKYEYDISFVTIGSSDEHKKKWIDHLREKTWTSDEVINELSEILSHFF